MESMTALVKKAWSFATWNSAADCSTGEFKDLKPFHSIPGPKGFPLLGTVLDYMKNGGYRFDKMFEVYLDRSTKYGPIYKETIGPITNVVISDYEEYKKMMKCEGKMPGRIPLDPLLTYRRTVGLPDGLVNANGEEWHKYRSAIQKKLLQGTEAAGCIPLLNQVTDDLLIALESCRDPTTGHMDSTEMETYMFRWAAEAVGGALLDMRMGCLSHPSPSPVGESFVVNLQGLFQEMQRLMYGLPIYKYWNTPTWKKFKGHCDMTMECAEIYVEMKLKVVLQARQAKTEGIVSVKARSQTEEPVKSEERVCLLEHLISESPLEMRESASVIVEILLGGMETVTNSLLWSLYGLSQLNPSSQEELYKEIQSQFGPGETITSEAISKMTYTKACLKEAHRLFTLTFATSRITGKDMELCGYHIPTGTHIQAHTYGLCHDANVFPQPYEYLPERWLAPSADMKVANLVWGHGPRTCVGRRIAELEVYVALIKIVHKYKVSYRQDTANGSLPKPILRTVLVPDTKLKFTFTPREEVAS